MKAFAFGVIGIVAVAVWMVISSPPMPPADPTRFPLGTTSDDMLPILAKAKGVRLEHHFESRDRSIETQVFPDGSEYRFVFERTIDGPFRLVYVQREK